MYFAKTTKTYFVLILLVIFMVGCDKEEYIAEFGFGDKEYKFTQNDFMEAYTKHSGANSKTDTTSVEEKEKFLELYLNFRLKVAEGENRNYLNDSEIKKELAEYEKNLSVSFLIDKTIIAPAIKKMYDRSLLEHSASHILIQNDPSDTTNTSYNKAVAIIDSLQKGFSFEDLAERNSQDPSAKTNKGNLSYFTAGSMVQEFEDEVYSLPVGSFSKTPVKTQFGYHIVKVNDRGESKGVLHVSHIMKRFSPEATGQDSIDAWGKFEAILDTLKSSKENIQEVFSNMAMKYSEDTYSKDRGGDIGPVERRGTIPEFDTVVFNLPLKTPSKVFKTPFGYHIAMVTSREPIKSFEDKKPELLETYNTYFFPTAQFKFIESLKKKYNLQSGDTKIFNELIASIDTNATTANGDWDSSITKETKEKTILKINGKDVSVATVLEAAKISSELQAISFKDPSAIVTIVNKVSEKLLLEQEAQKVVVQYPEFKKIMNEYEEGVMLFKIEQNEVWEKAKGDSATLYQHFKTTTKNYSWPDRVNMQEIYVANDSIAEVVIDNLKGYKISDTVKTSKKTKKGKTEIIEKLVEPISFDSAAALFSTRYETKNQKGVWGLQPISTNELTGIAWTMNENSEPQKIKFENGVSIIRLIQKDPARLKTFSEAIPEVSSAWQDLETKRLGEKFTSSLAKKYNLKINKELFKKLNSKK